MWIFERTNMESVLKKIMPTKKSSRSNILYSKEHILLLKEASIGMSTESLTNRTMKIFMGAIYMRFIDSRY